MRSLLTVAVAALIAVGVPGCGSDDGGPRNVSGSPEQDNVARTIRAYYNAVADGDGLRACALLTPQLARTVAGQADTGADCPTAIMKTHQQNKELVKQLRDLKVDATKITVTATGASLGADAFGQAGRPSGTMRLVRTGTTWTVSALQ